MKKRIALKFLSRTFKPDPAPAKMSRLRNTAHHFCKFAAGLGYEGSIPPNPVLLSLFLISLYTRTIPYSCSTPIQTNPAAPHISHLLMLVLLVPDMDAVSWSLSSGSIRSTALRSNWELLLLQRERKTGFNCLKTNDFLYD